MAPSLRRVTIVLALFVFGVTGEAAAQAKRHEKLFEEAQTHFAERRWADGLPVLEKAVEAARVQEGEGTFALYDLQFKLAEVTKLAGHHDEAIERMQEALATLRAWPEHGDDQEAAHLHRLAQYHHAVGDHRARAERLAEAVGLIDQPQTQAHLPNYLVALADAKDDLGEMAEALPLLERALPLLDRASQPARVVETLNRIAIAHDWLGHYDQALAAYRRALRVAESSFDDHHLQVANALNNLGQAITLVGHLREAQGLFERAMTIAEAHGERGHYTLMAVMQNYAGLWDLRGDPERATTLSRRGVELAAATTGKAHPSYATALAGLAERLAATQPDEALRIGREVLALRRRLLGEGHPAVALTQASMADTLLDLGRYEDAFAENGRALAAAANRLAPNHRLVVDGLEREAVIRYRRGDEPEKARALLERARRMGVEVQGETSLKVAAIDRHLARVAILAGRPSQALTHLRRALETEDVIVGELLGAGTDPQRRTLARRLAQTTSDALDVYFTHLPDDADARRLAMRAVLRRKGLALEVMTDRLTRLRRGPGRELLAELAAARGRLARMVLGGEADGGRVGAERERVRHLEARVEEGQLLRPRIVDLKDVASALRSDEALLEIHAYQPTGPTMAASGARRYGALVLARDGIRGARDLGRVADVDALARDYLAAASDPATDPARAARSLHAALVAPLLPLIGDADHLRVSPDGALFLVPFAGTVDEQGRSLVDRFHISYLSTGRELLERTPSTASGVAVLVGAPAFGPLPHRVAEGSRLGLSFPPLPGTAEEVRTLAARLAPRMGEVRVLVGADASERRIEALHRPALLHIATHGFFLRPGAGGLATADGERGARVARPAVRVLGVEAQLRSALVFSGANQPSSTTADDDGLLTAFEAATLDLEGTRLVVMSGCETGVGDVEGAEGVLGLRRAFALAGVQTQVMSLWRVSDASTTALMDRYYDALASGAGRADALRDAQRALRRRPETAHPYYWAGFIVSGQPGPIFEPADGVAEVSPSSRGCACATETRRDDRSGRIAAFALLLLMFARRRAR